MRRVPVTVTDGASGFGGGGGGGRGVASEQRPAGDRAQQHQRAGADHHEAPRRRQRRLRAGVRAAQPPPRLLQRRREHAHVGVAAGAIARQRLEHHRVEPRRDPARRRRQRRRHDPLRADRLEHLGDRRPLERPLADEQLVEHDAERPHLRLRIAGCAVGLLGCHVHRRAHERARHRQALRRRRRQRRQRRKRLRLGAMERAQRIGIGRRPTTGPPDCDGLPDCDVESSVSATAARSDTPCSPLAARRRRRLLRLGRAQLRQPEVEHLDAPIARAHQVVALDVAMQDLPLVRRRQRLGRVGHQAQRLRRLDPLARQLRQRLAVDELHDHEDLPVPRPDVVHRHDPRMVQRARRLRLAQEARLHLLLAGARYRQQLERNRPPQALVDGAPHLAHRTLAQPRHQPIVRDALHRPWIIVRLLQRLLLLGRLVPTAAKMKSRLAPRRSSRSLSSSASLTP